MRSTDGAEGVGKLGLSVSADLGVNLGHVFILSHFESAVLLQERYLEIPFPEAYLETQVWQLAR